MLITGRNGASQAPPLQEGCLILCQQDMGLRTSCVMQCHVCFHHSSEPALGRDILSGAWFKRPCRVQIAAHRNSREIWLV